MENKDTKEYKYDAFISYRHAQLDGFVAENLHKLLETFKVPRIAADSIKNQKKNKISRVFRDRDELPLSSNLSDNIQNALETSEFLIVICSPRTPESLWVQKEIKTFISMHGREKVLAILIEGEPEQSFPKELCYEKVEKVLEDGSKCTVEQEVEPLAADVRGKDKREVLKNLKKEILRVAAPLLGCSYDDLKQRHRERKIKRMMVASLAAAAVFLVFGSISMTMALRIQKQSVVIQEQSEEIEAQYQEVLKRQAYTMADTSTELLADGNRIAAMLVAKEALTQMPYTEQAQYALTEAVRVYENGSIVMPAHLLQMSTNVYSFSVSPEGNYILTVDITGKLSVWEALSGTEICSIVSDPEYGYPKEEEFGFADENHIVFPRGENLIIYDIETKKEAFCLPIVVAYSFATHDGTNLLAVADDEKVYLIDLNNYTVKMEYIPEENWDWINKMAFNESGTLLACSAGCDFGSSAKIVVLDTQKNKYVREMMFSDQDVFDVLFTDEEHLVLSRQKNFDGEFGEDSTVELLEARTGNVKWSKVFNSEWIDELQLLKDKSVLACRSYDTLTMLTVRDGKETKKQMVDSGISGIIPLEGQNIILILRDGRAVFVSKDLEESYDYSSIFQLNSKNLADFESGNGFYVSMPYNSNAVTVYQSTIGSGVEEIAEFLDTIRSAVFDRSGKSYLVNLYGSNEQGRAYLMDAGTNEKLAGFELDTMIYEAFFIGENDEQIGLFTDEALYFYDRDGNYLRQLDYEDYDGTIVSVKEDGSSFVVLIGDVLKCFETATLNVIAELPLEESNTLWAMAEKYCVTISKEKEEMQVYDFFTGEMKKSIPINSAFISTLFTDEKEQFVFVTYRDNTVEVYDMENLELKKTFTELQEEILLCINSDEKNIYILRGASQAYICNADNFEIIARVPGFKCIAPDGESMLISKRKILAKIPFYDIDALLSETEKQLKDRVLSKEERERYHLGEITEVEEAVEESTGTE